MNSRHAQLPYSSEGHDSCCSNMSRARWDQSPTSVRSIADESTLTALISAIAAPVF
jgi:hypothetical protein